jgi:gas vesicle protein
MIDVVIPFLLGLMVGAAGGVMIAALLVASRESEKIGAKTGRYNCQLWEGQDEEETND